MDYVDKINLNNTDYDIQDSKAARSVDGDTSSHVLEADQLHTSTGVSQTEAFIYRTSAGDASISNGSATLLSIEGNTVQTGHSDEQLVQGASFANETTTYTFDADVFRANTVVAGCSSLRGSATYDGSAWTFEGIKDGVAYSAAFDPAAFGFVITGNVTPDDTISVIYTALVIGTLSTATPTSFVATGYNQYDAVAGYAHVKGNNQYRIAGTYTSLGFTTEIGGTTTAVTVTDGKFTPAEDGYIYVVGASGDILIALVWSGIRDSDPFEAYETSTIAIPTTDSSSQSLPTASYGMPSVGEVRDELNFSDRTYIQRIGHYAYSAANLATVEALGVDYLYDTSDIFYVLDTPITFTLADTVTGAYTVNDFGTEEFTGTDEPVIASIYYGNNLVDKLRNILDIQSLGPGLGLVGSELRITYGDADSTEY